MDPNLSTYELVPGQDLLLQHDAFVTSTKIILSVKEVRTLVRIHLP